MHHDQIFGDFAGDGSNQLAFWVQRSEILCLATSAPRSQAERTLAARPDRARSGPAEGMAKADIDGDGKIDMIGGGYWFKHQGEMAYQPMLIDKQSLTTRRTAAGQIVEGAAPEVVFVVGRRHRTTQLVRMAQRRVGRP